LTSSRSRSLSWEFKKRGDETLVIFNGQVDEVTDFTPLEKISGKVTFDLAGVRRFNSEGVRRWINFIRELDAVTKLSFVRCSLAVVTQLNLIRGFQGKAKIRSFYAPYVCVASGETEDRLLNIEDISDPLNPPVFQGDHGEMELDDIAERYFAFITCSD
jgi:hypothetical protein